MAHWAPVTARRFGSGAVVIPPDPGGIEPVMVSPPVVSVNGATPASRYQWVNTTVNEEATGRWTASFAPLSGANIVTPAAPAVFRALGIGFAGITHNTAQPDPDRDLLRTRINEAQANQALAHCQYRLGITHNGQWMRLNTWSNGGRYRVRVNGELVTLESQALGGALTNRTIDVQFASVDERHVEFEVSQGVFPYGAACGVGETLVLPDAPTSKRLYVIGDSFAVGAQSSSKGFRDMVHLAAAEAGIVDVTVDALGGTGYGKTNPGLTPPWDNYATRISNNIGTGKAMPEIVVCDGSTNDKFVATTLVEANATSLFASLNTILPGVPVVVCFFGEGDTNIASDTARMTRVQTAAAAAPNVVAFQDYMGLLTGTGNTKNPKGDGTRDIWLYDDDTHPTTAGHIEYAHHIATDLLIPFI